MSRPIVASFCSTFLKPEMLHIYRQVTGLERHETFIIAKERRCEEQYPFPRVEMLRPGRKNFLRRFYLKYIRRLPPLCYRREWQSLLGIMKEHPADLMHVYFGHTGVHLLPFIQYWDRPCIVSFHGADVKLREDRPQYEQCLKVLFQSVPLVLARSGSLRDRLMELGCPAEKIRLNRTGIPLEEFPFRERPAVEEGAWHFIQTCRLIPKKGLMTALEAFAMFRRSFPKATYTIAGEGEMLAKLRERAAALGIADAVSFPGFLPAAELNALYAKSHVFLHPSEMTESKDQEGIPNAMLEAMAAGLPVVATLHGGIPEAVVHEESGLLVPERSPAQLAEAMLRITSSLGCLQQIGRQASERVRAEFEQKAAIANLEAIYDEAIELGRPVMPSACL